MSAVLWILVAAAALVVLATVLAVAWRLGLDEVVVEQRRRSHRRWVGLDDLTEEELQRVALMRFGPGADYWRDHPEEARERILARRARQEAHRRFLERREREQRGRG